MNANRMIEEAERASREQYPDDPRARLAFQCGMLQGYIQRMDAEIETLKQFQQNDQDEILNLTRELIEKDNA
jgi:hypothetical protein